MLEIGGYKVTILDKDGKEMDSMPGDLEVFELDGKAVTLKEAEEGNLRQSDYTRKTTSVAELQQFMTELGIQDQSQGVRALRAMLGTYAELEDLGVLDPKTGAITYEPGGKPPDNPDDDTTVQLDPQTAQLIKSLEARLGTQEQDMGRLLAVMSKRDIRETFSDLTEEQFDWVFAMARDNPERSPMDYAKALNTMLEAKGQTAVDAAEEERIRLKKESLERPSGAGGTDLFDEDVVITDRPDLHQKEGVTVKTVSPLEAATTFLEAAEYPDEE